MSKPHFLSAAESAAYGAKLSGVEVAVHHPVPLSSPVITALRKMHACSFIESESFSSALNVAMGSVLAGKRTFIACSAPTAGDDIYTVAYNRLPVVMMNISRPLGTYSIKQDHSDILSIRDSGWIIFMPESNQEALESVIQAYKVSETVMLPSVVNIDMHHISEVVQLPNENYTNRFVAKPNFSFFKRHSYVGVPLDDYSQYKHHQHKAMKNVLDVTEKASDLWKKNTKRALPVVEMYKLEDAEYALVICGYHSQTAKSAVDKMRTAGMKVGLLRLRVVRPFPSEIAKNALSNARKVAVIDQSVSLGSSGILYNEIRHLARHCSSFISLGTHLNEGHFSSMIENLAKSEKEDTVWL